MAVSKKQNKNTKKSLRQRFNWLLTQPIFPLLTTAWLVLARYNRNVDQLAFHYIWPILICSLLIVGAILALLVWRKVAPKVFIYFAWAVLAFFVYGDIHTVLVGVSNQQSWLHFMGTNGATAVGLVVASFGLFLLVHDRQIKTERIYRVLNGVLLTLLCFNLLAPLQRVLQRQVTIPSNNELKQQSVNQSSSSDRDVYYLVFDRYASNETLKKLYGYDNSPFLTFLKNRGFFVNENAHSNYQFTTMSVASTLNLRYFDQEQNAYKDTDKNLQPYYDLLNHNAVGKFVKQFGYKYFHVGSWWEPTKASSEATASFARGSYITIFNQRVYPNEFTQLMLQNTLLKPLLERPIKVKNFTVFELVIDIRQVHANNFAYQIQTLHKLQNNKQKKYVFVHFLMPHPPFVYKADGQVYFDDTNEVDKKAYIEQLKYTNAEIEKMVTELQSRPGQQPVIVIQADEGPYPKNFYEQHKDGNDHKYPWPKASPNDLQEKFGVLSAYYLPGEPKQQPHQGITGVNTFRLIFNNYFGTNLPLLADRSYVYESNDRYYNYVDITDKLKR